MEIIIADPTYDQKVEVGNARLFELKDKINDLESDSKFVSTDIGHGADWPVLLITLAGIFLLGDKIEKNIDAWVSLSEKFMKFVGWVKNKYSYRIDLVGAKFIALNDLFKGTKVDSLSILKEETIVFDEFPKNKAGILDKKPSALYIIVFKVNNNVIRIYGIKSKGSIEICHDFSSDWLEF